jgi:hypothetical protein
MSTPIRYCLRLTFQVVIPGLATCFCGPVFLLNLLGLCNFDAVNGLVLGIFGMGFGPLFFFTDNNSRRWRFMMVICGFLMTSIGILSTVAWFLYA